jgi:hypothetical protein
VATTTPRRRVETEFAELSAKLTKLEDFIATPKFLTLPLNQQELLHEQRAAMRRYRDILNTRLNSWVEV